MDQRKLILAVVILITCVIATSISVLIVQNFKLAVVAYVLGVGVFMLVAEPFLGLLNYLAFVYLRPQEFIAGFKGLPVMLVLGAASLGISIMYLALRRRFFIKGAQDYTMLWLFVAIIASHLANFYTFGAVQAANDFLSRIALYFLITTLVVNMKRLRITMGFLVLLTIYQAGQGMYQKITGVGIAGQELVEDRIYGVGTFADPNVLALTFLIVMPFLFFKCVQRGSLSSRFLAGVSGVILIAGLYLTNSRGGFLSFGLIGLMVFARRYGMRVGAMAGLALIAATVALGPSRLRHFSQREASAYGRVEAWAVGMELIQHKPIFGVGSGMFLDYHFREAHNSFVQVASELGVFGLMPWILLIILGLKNLNFVRCSMHERAPPGISLYADSLFYGLLAFVVGAFFISRAYSDLFYLMVGLSAAVTNIYTASTGEKYVLVERKDFVQSLALIVGLLFLLKVYLVLYW